MYEYTLCTLFPTLFLIRYTTGNTSGTGTAYPFGTKQLSHLLGYVVVNISFFVWYSKTTYYMYVIDIVSYSLYERTWEPKREKFDSEYATGVIRKLGSWIT
jgi:hypothetical protein